MQNFLSAAVVIGILRVVRERSGSIDMIEGLLARDSSTAESLCSVLEQDTLSAA